MIAALPDVETVAVVAWCNRARDELGLPPVPAIRPGVPGNPWFCPIGRTVGEGMPRNLQPEFAGQTFRVWAGPKIMRLEMLAPPVVAKWSEDFDLGHHPDLVMPREVAFRVGWW